VGYTGENFRFQKGQFFHIPNHISKKKNHFFMRLGPTKKIASHFSILTACRPSCLGVKQKNELQFF